MVLLMMSLGLCDVNQKYHAGPHISHLKLTNKMVPLTMLSMSHDAGTGANSIIFPKESCDTLFQLPSPYKQNCAVCDTINIT